MIFTPQHFRTYSLDHSAHGADICRILAAALNGANPERCIANHIDRLGNALSIDRDIYNLADFRRIYTLAVGKASVSMMNAIYPFISDRLEAGIVITKDGYLGEECVSLPKNILIFQASHPIPTDRNLHAASRVFHLAHNINSSDLLIVLLSGGGSSLLTHPAQGLTLNNIQETTNLLLACGATINEINTIRKHIDDFKGGGLARLFFPATVVTLILSDVIDDPLDVIASGPTTFDPTTYHDAWDILEKYQLLDLIPQEITTHISMGIAEKVSETLKAGDPALKTVKNIVIGNNSQTSMVAAAEAMKLGYHAKILTNALQGEASKAAGLILKQSKVILAQSTEEEKPVCLIAGGETTVTLRGNGFGGRNQELVLGAVPYLAGINEKILVSLATDGGDGPTDAAGAVATNETYSRGSGFGMEPREYIDRNDSYHYFERLDDLIKTGPTLTNVNDLVFYFSWNTRNST